VDPADIFSTSIFAEHLQNDCNQLDEKATEKEVEQFCRTQKIHSAAQDVRIQTQMNKIASKQ
jgi:hypothetical protein